LQAALVFKDDAKAHEMNPRLAFLGSDLMADKPPHVGDGQLPLDPITRCLRLVYSEVAADPLPDELARLLQELEATDKGPPDG